MKNELKDLRDQAQTGKALSNNIPEQLMTIEQKKVLGKSIMSLDKKDLRGVYDIVRENMKMDGKTV